jgi:hypothetical protein
MSVALIFLLVLSIASQQFILCAGPSKSPTLSPTASPTFAPSAAVKNNGYYQLLTYANFDCSGDPLFLTAYALGTCMPAGAATLVGTSASTTTLSSAKGNYMAFKAGILNNYLYNYRYANASVCGLRVGDTATLGKNPVPTTILTYSLGCTTTTATGGNSVFVSILNSVLPSPPKITQYWVAIRYDICGPSLHLSRVSGSILSPHGLCNLHVRRG